MLEETKTNLLQALDAIEQQTMLIDYLKGGLNK